MTLSFYLFSIAMIIVTVLVMYWCVRYLEKDNYYNEKEYIKPDIFTYGISGSVGSSVF